MKLDIEQLAMHGRAGAGVQVQLMHGLHSFIIYSFIRLSGTTGWSPHHYVTHAHDSVQRQQLQGSRGSTAAQTAQQPFH